MLSYTLFRFGPYEVCLLNLIALFLIFFVAYVVRKFIHRALKRYLLNANIHLQGRRATWLRLLSQSIYLLAGYVAIMSFKINNDAVTFTEFLNFDIIKLNKFKVNFYQIIFIIANIIIARMLLNFLRLYFNKKFRGKADYNPSTEYVYIQISKYVIYITTFFFCLNQLEINPSVFLGGSAALLVGLGLGLQDVFKDWFSGLILLFEGTMKIGDVIELKDAKFKEPIVAKVLKINVRTTQIETRDGNVLLIPNAKLTQEYVENWSHGNNIMRFTIDLVVAYHCDIELVKTLLRQAALSHPKVNKTHPVIVRMRDFGERGLNLELMFWVDQTWDANNYKSEVRFEIDRLFRLYNVRIPAPQRQVWINNTEGDFPGKDPGS